MQSQQDQPTRQFAIASSPNDEGTDNLADSSSGNGKLPSPFSQTSAAVKGNYSAHPGSTALKFSAQSRSTAFNFPYKLRQILNTPEFNDIICWLPHGRAWRVQQQERLESDVLPKFFQHQKYSSFSRQVYGWGFQRILSGRDYNSFYHELFLRDSPELSLKMKRPSRTELAERRQALADSPPNFYLMPPVSESSNASESGSSSPSVALDDNLDMLRARLFNFSLQEQGMYIQMELDRLEKRRKQLLRGIQLLKNQSREAQLTLRSQHHGDASSLPFLTTGQKSLQNTAMQSQQQQLPSHNLSLASMRPWMQKAAQDIYLESQRRRLLQGQRGSGENIGLTRSQH